MPISVRKLLIHYNEIIAFSLLAVGQTKEDFEKNSRIMQYIDQKLSKMSCEIAIRNKQ